MTLCHVMDTNGRRAKTNTMNLPRVSLQQRGGNPVRIATITPLSGDRICVRVYEADHAAFLRLAEDLKASADTFPISMRGKRQRCGIAPRDFHCWNVLTGTPSSDAPSFIRSQSSFGVGASVMPSAYTDDLSDAQGQNVGGARNVVSLRSAVMADENDTERAYDMRAAQMILSYQEARGWEHADMVDFLGGGISVDNYQSYKRRMKFPFFIIVRFCKFTGLAFDGVPAEGVKKQKSRKRSKNENKSSI